MPGAIGAQLHLDDDGNITTSAPPLPPVPEQLAPAIDVTPPPDADAVTIDTPGDPE